MGSVPTGNRNLLVDVARCYALVFVYYGHIVERIMDLGDKTALYQYKFIYSFHMVAFVLLAGYISKHERLPLGNFVRKTFFTRIIPLIFFNALNILILQFVSQAVQFSFVNTNSISGYLWGLARTAAGFPVFDIVMWFLYMLIAVEVIHYVVFPYIAGKKTILIAALLFYVGGYLLNRNISFFRPDKILWNFWFLHEAVVVYSFYLVGIYLSRWKGLEVKRSGLLIFGLTVISFFIIYFTYDLNTGPFSPYRNAVVIAASFHGNLFFFPLTAMVGSLFILFLAKITPLNKYILLVGQNAMIVFPLNGIFYTFINGRVAQWMYDNLPHNPLVIFASSSVVTLASLMLCIPCIYLFNASIPQLIGKPRVRGPIFRNFL